MTITAPQLESFLYADLAGLQKITVEDSGAVAVDLELTATATLSDALTDWQTQANASGDLAGTYTFAWLPATQQVSLLCSESFDLDLDGSLDLALGFTTASMSGKTSYTSDDTPLAAANPLGIDYDVPWPLRESVLTRRRFGRVESRQHYRAMETVVRVTMLADQADSLMGGPLFAAALRVYPHGYTSGAYDGSPGGDIRGYLDCYPYEMRRGEPYGSDDSLVDVAIACTVEEV